MISIEQIRAARAMLGLSAKDLARASGLSSQDIEALERGEMPGIDLARLKATLEGHGIVFVAAGEDNPGAGPGVRLRQAPADEGLRPEHLSSANDG
ncbi:Helix-turn-helix [Rhizobium sp. RU35A]|uniref:Helix-turn-helix domain-containing protein n=1 Tax=Rhizobium straminoryzae TaxID=1387186 RepID=A0A549T9H2_9HYPH|nr:MULTISPECIES: helix-turn-helix domain-containing protein [Rhizobium]TRL38518.1 helix-turn-helix domain-containing protein [Rhizobium straminoryzae]SIP90448.1 Helix-turn-helix [Rhizobium sp. RU35A]